MKQPKIRVLETGEVYKVIALHWLDNGTTLRAFPLREPKEGEVLSYVLIQGEGEETEVNAEFAGKKSNVQYPNLLAFYKEYDGKKCKYHTFLKRVLQHGWSKEDALSPHTRQGKNKK